MAKVVTCLADDILTITINRPELRNCVDGPTALLLAEAFEQFEKDDSAKVAILTGSGGHFCAGADLKAIASENPESANRLDSEGHGPMGPSRMRLSKPVIAAINGYCVAGGLELAIWCDLRVASKTAQLGIFCRRFGVPLIDGGTVRLPRLIGMSHAMDMILTGREVAADEAKQMGLINRLSNRDDCLPDACELARQIAQHPQTCLINDRRSVYEQWSMDEKSALENEFQLGMNTIRSGETVAGAKRFTG
ncbi:enoyl-CoA hydratase [Oleiphilus messinensis]|uniref:Enoyl-CoA hydratase n=1 Tax=Oleiphilus messinensis TaxID=141451 RepID=A0A1Y0I8G0_9GAMM|nr:crotonase/enoyl-CoA hydratase family protein [Oleiphilus messinensis]ARU56787.1 enoyl-CoA hydratase [Oleiphilus messinensis]